MNYLKTLGLLLFFVLFTWAGAQVRLQLPGLDVPFTMQSLAVVASGFFLGARLGLMSQLMYLFAGYFLPVFAGETSGLAFYTSTTAGYVLAFPLAAFFCGWRKTDTLLTLCFTAFAAHIIILFSGSFWVMAIKATFSMELWMKTFVWFLPGAVVKSGTAALLYLASLKLKPTA